MKKYRVAIITVLFSLPLLFMAASVVHADPILDGTANTSGTSVSSLTYSFTNTSGAWLEVGAAINDPARSITGITYNGDALTKDVDTSGSTVSANASMWHLETPDVGTHDIVVTYSGSGNVNSGAASWECVVGVGATAMTEETGADTSATISLTTTAADSVIQDTWILGGMATGVAAGTPAAILWNNDSGSRTSFSAYAPFASIGSHSISWTWTSSNAALGVAVELLNDSSCTPPTPPITGAATSSIEQSQTNLAYAYFIFLASMVTMIWIMRKH